MEALREKALITSRIKQERNSTQETASKSNGSVKNMSQNCAICRTEYLLVDFKTSRICDECVQYIKDNC